MCGASTNLSTVEVQSLADLIRIYTGTYKRKDCREEEEDEDSIENRRILQCRIDNNVIG